MARARNWRDVRTDAIESGRISEDGIADARRYHDERARAYRLRQLRKPVNRRLRRRETESGLISWLSSEQFQTPTPGFNARLCVGASLSTLLSRVPEWDLCRKYQARSAEVMRPGAGRATTSA